MEHAPHVSWDIRYKFRVVQCGVFRIRGILRVIEALMCLDPGEGREYIDSLLDDIKAVGGGSDRVPALDLSFGEGFQAWSRSSTFLLLLVGDSVTI